MEKDKLLAQKKNCLDALGIEIWRDKNRVEDEIVENKMEVKKESVPKPEIVEETKAKVSPMCDEADAATCWQQLEQEVKACQLCPLSQSRIQTVFGVGSQNAKLLFVGEAPGANEDKQGEPFVGRAGKLLTSMVKSIGLEREDVYIANVLKCRPPNNRDPSSKEVELCTSYLARQIALIKPNLIVAVGRIAAHYLLNTDSSMKELRSVEHSYDLGESKIPVLVIYHPAYLLRSPREKRKAYVDMLLIKKIIEV